MTAYDLFKRAHSHNMGQFMGHKFEGTNQKDYIDKDFSEAIEEYSIDYACNIGFKLSYNGNLANKKVIDLKQIEMQAGYYLCNYDGHTGDWLMMYFDSRSGALAAYKELYDKYFKHMEWYWIIKID